MASLKECLRRWREAPKNHSIFWFGPHGIMEWSDNGWKRCPAPPTNAPPRHRNDPQSPDHTSTLP